MPFQCQVDSYQKEFESTVLSCTPAAKDGYEVILDDTILFPEGGGQPDDRGTLDEVEVLRVSRRGIQAVHLTPTPLQVGTKVRQKVDWTRRFDHMQQHSGQHLICAVAKTLYGFETTSWWLGDQISFNEFDTQSITTEQMDEIERICNERIRDAVPVRVDLYQPDDPKLAGKDVEGIPEELRSQPVRIVTIQGVDEDRCCGTHVANLSHLQAVKVIRCEKGKKGKTNLFFLVGGRVISQLTQCLDREKKLTELLKNGPADHIGLVTKLQKTLKLSQKNLTTALRDVATLEAKRFKELNPRPRYFSLHRKDAESDFINVVISEIADQSVLLFLTTGEDKGAGQMTLCGPLEVVQELGPKVCELLGGKGAGKGGRFSAKVTNLGKRSEAEKLVAAAVSS